MTISACNRQYSISLHHSIITETETDLIFCDGTLNTALTTDVDCTDIFTFLCNCSACLVLPLAASISSQNHLRSTE